MDELRALREQMDGADDELLAAFERRKRVAGQIGRLKKRDALPTADEGRERAVLERLTARCAPDLRAYLPSVWGALFAASKAFQLTPSSDKDA